MELETRLISNVNKIRRKVMAIKTLSLSLPMRSKCHGGSTCRWLFGDRNRGDAAEMSQLRRNTGSGTRATKSEAFFTAAAAAPRPTRRLDEEISTVTWVGRKFYY